MKMLEDLHAEPLVDKLFETYARDNRMSATSLLEFMIIEQKVRERKKEEKIVRIIEMEMNRKGKYGEKWFFFFLEIM